MAAMSFPLKLDAGLGRFRRLTEEEEIAQSVRLILSTNRGERPCRPKFGSRLAQYAFEPVSTTLKTQIRLEIISALQAWEPRIWNIEVAFEPDRNDGALIANISYEILRGGRTAQISVPIQPE